jgi:diguanylate cyclase (GGDEF)-like protein
MSYLSDISLRRGIGLLVLVLAILLGGTWATVEVTINHLLNQNAKDTARNWASFLAANVNDLDKIAAGEQPSATSLAFFQATRKAGEVFRYVIFNRQGYSQLVSDRDGTVLVSLSEYSPEAARAAATGQPVVDAKNGHSPTMPSYFAEAFVPIDVVGQPLVTVAAYVDQTDQRNHFFYDFLLAAAALCLLTGFSFGIPAVAWYHRTREKQHADRRIGFLAQHDALTGLANRADLNERLKQALALLPLHRASLAVHFIDIDHFKAVNDTYGHDGGDYLLSTFAARLCAVTRVEDVVARLGGDEFVVVQTNVTSKDQVEDLARRLSSALVAPMRFKEQDIFVTVSVGIALAPADGNNLERLLKCADLALYKAKTDGRNCIRFFAGEMDSQLQARVAIEKAVRDAVLHERFILHYQPVFEISDRHLIGFEALLRLPLEDGTLIPPLDFIPIAEDLRLIGKIGAWVLREACRTAATWPEHLTVAVNLSPAQFEAGSVSDIVAAALVETGLAPHRLELEITETLLLGNSEAILAALQTLKAIGVAIVMDDFGTGYSSLSYLWRFPFNKIKIDRSFMQGFDNSGRNAETVVKTIIALGRELHMRITVEGVETAQQVAFLDSANADLVQGFYFGRPVPASELAASILADFQKTLPTPSSATAQETTLVGLAN